MNRRGVVLIEVLVAVAILGTAALSFMSFLVTTQEMQYRQHERLLEEGQAERLLIANALLTRVELEQRLGVREAGAFLVWIDRPEPSLFRIGISTASAPEREILSTLVYRREQGTDES